MRRFGERTRPGTLVNTWLPRTNRGPLSVDNCILWLDAADTATITSSSGAVSQWNDKSGNNRHATQPTAANQPTTGTRTINSRNVIDFDGTTDRMGFGDYTSSNGLTAFAVGVPDAIVGGADIFNGLAFVTAYRSGFGRDFALQLRNSRASVYAETTTNGREATAGTVTVGTPLLITGQSNTTQTIVRLNGVAGSAASASVNNLVISHVANDPTFSALAPYYDGGIGEIIVYNATLTASEISTIEQYLNEKWAVY